MYKYRLFTRKNIGHSSPGGGFNLTTFETVTHCAHTSFPRFLRDYFGHRSDRLRVARSALFFRAYGKICRGLIDPRLRSFIPMIPIRVITSAAMM